MSDTPTKTLGPYLIIDPKTGYSFADLPKEQSELQFLQKHVGGSIEGILATRELTKNGYELYANEDGMLARLPMNTYSAPFIQPNMYMRMAMMGGPYGTLVLVAPPHKGHSRSLMSKDFPFMPADEDDEDDEFRNSYRKAMNKALK